MTRRHSRVLLTAILMFGFLAVARNCQAQVLYGSLLGNVKDASGAAVSGATVELINLDTQQSREGTSNENGGYDFATILPGKYNLKVTKPGFATSTETGIVINASAIQRLDVSLKVGAVTETVNVSAATALLQSDRADVRAELSTSELANLPMAVGRNYQSLFVTIPGFGAIQSSYNSTPSNPSKALVFNVNGASFNINNTRIDGAQSINVWLPHQSAYVPTLEAIETVNVVTNSYDAETGMAGGAAVTVITKSGTNDIHGSAFEYHNDQHLNAAPFFLPKGQVKPKLVINEFGGSVGGSIIKNKLFYFSSYEGTDDREAAAYFATVPNANIKSGNMQGQNNPIYDPLTGDANGANRTPFANQIVPANRMDPIAVKLAGMTPLPNLSNLLSSNYYVTGSYIFDRKRLDAKVNYNPFPKLTTFVRFGFLNYNMQNNPIFGDLGGPQVASAGGNPGHGYGNTFTTTFAGTYVLGPRLIVDAYVGWARMGTNIDTPGLDQKRGLALGIPGTNGPAKYQGGLPRFGVSSYDDIGTPGAYLPYYRSDPATNYVANLNWSKGSHDIRLGVDISQLAMNHTQAEGGYGAGMGGFLFTGGPTSTVGGPSGNQFNSYASFLMGLASSAGINTIYAPGANGVITTRAWQDGLYIRDRWNVTPALTLSYGVRWEYFPMVTRADQGIGLYNVNTNNVEICGTGLVPSNCNVKLSKKEFSPRLGIAYRFANNLVVRAGYGITNDPYSLGRPFKYNYPTLTIATYDPANSYQWFTTLQNGLPATPVPNIGSGLISLPGAFQTTTIDLNSFKRGYIQSWNLTVQKELHYGFVAQAAYVATRATDQLGPLDINAGQVPGAGSAGQPLKQLYGRTAVTTQYQPLGTNQYNALQSKLERRFAQGVQVAVTYTWSKAIGISANDDATPRVNALPYFYLNRTVQNFDRTQNMALSSVLELPFGKGKPFLSENKFASVLLGGWKVNSLLSLMTGLPFSVTASGSSLNMPGQNSQRADQVLANASILGGVGSLSSYFDPLAFKPVTGARFGNAGFNSLRGPGVAVLDLGLAREFAVRERIKIQFRAEAFNATNSPHFGLPGTNASNLVLNTDGSVKNLAGYSAITSTQNLGRDFDERHLRFGLRVGF